MTQLVYVLLYLHIHGIGVDFMHFWTHYCITFLISDIPSALVNLNHCTMVHIQEDLADVPI